MDIFDKNSEPFTPLIGDRQYIPKLKKVDYSLNKLIQEFVDIQNSTSGSPVSLNAAIVNIFQNIIENKIVVSGSGIYKQVSGNSLTLSTSPIISESLIGEFRAIGHWDSYSGDVAVSQGHLPAIAPIFNFDTGVIETIYQRYPIFDSTNTEVENFCLLAIDNDYAICGQLESFATGRLVAITPYNTDSQIDVTATWLTYKMTDGNELNFIDVGAGYIVKNIVMIKPGKFLIVTSYETPTLTTYNVKIVTYTTPLLFTVDTIACDIIAAGATGYTCDGDMMRVAIDIDTLEISVSIDIGDTVDQGTAMFVIDGSNSTITSSSVDLNSSEFSPLSQLAAINERCFFLQLSDFYYKGCIASFGGIKIDYATNNYGTKIEYRQYTARTVDVNGGTTYSDLSALFEPLSSTLMAAKLTAIGFTPTDPSNFPIFGGVSGYIR